MANERRKQPFPLAPFPHLLRRLLSVCPPCSSAWRSWGSRRHGRFLTKDRAEILQRHELPPSRTLRSRNCPRSEDIFILADITRGLPCSSVPICFDRHMAVLWRSQLHGPQSDKVQESQSHPRLSTEGGHVGRPWSRGVSVTFHPGYSNTTRRLPPGPRGWHRFRGKFTVMLKQVTAGSHK